MKLTLKTPPTESHLHAMAAQVADLRQSLMLIGPPGCGKTLIARRVCEYLPPLNDGQKLELAWIHAGARMPAKLWPYHVPLRAPHCSVSRAAMTGAFTTIRPNRRGPDYWVARPGELSLAHCGVLFLDDLPDFRLSTIEAIGIVLRKGYSELCTRYERVRIPARPSVVICTALPCPCGWYGSTKRACRCSENTLVSWMVHMQKARALLPPMQEVVFASDRVAP